MMMIFKSLELDATEVRVVWRASVTVMDEQGEVEFVGGSFHIDRKTDAQEWLEDEAAALRCKYGISP